jgi:hypothetical protein
MPVGDEVVEDVDDGGRDCTALMLDYILLGSQRRRLRRRLRILLLDARLDLSDITDSNIDDVSFLGEPLLSICSQKINLYA